MSENSVKCLLCSNEMQLFMFPDINYWQCLLEETHRMLLSEYSDLVRKEKSEDDIHSAMGERAGVLLAQIGSVNP